MSLDLRIAVGASGIEFFSIESKFVYANKKYFARLYILIKI